MNYISFEIYMDTDTPALFTSLCL